MTQKIKRGVSLYSFQNETYLGKMSLDQAIGHCAAFGARGIEVVGEQTFAGWPECGMPEAAIADWHRSMQRHDTVPVCHDFMLDYKRYKDRPMPFDEQVRSVQNDIDFAARLGMRFIRSLVSVAPEVLVAAAPYAEDKGITILLEVHARCISTIRGLFAMPKPMKSQHPGAGLPAGYGDVLARFPRVWKERFIRNGCPQAAADFIEKAYEERTLSEYVIPDVMQNGAGPAAGDGGNAAPQRGVRAEADARFYAADPQHSCQIL